MKLFRKQKKLTYLGLILAGVVSSSYFAIAQDETKEEKPAIEFKSDDDKISYMIGTQIGQGMRMQGEDLDLDIVFKAIKTVLDGKTPAMDEAQQQKLVKEYSDMMAKKMEEKANAATKENREKSLAFLEENKKKEGVIELPSGLQYKVIKEGDGATPTKTDRVLAHYRGTLIDGTEFDSSYKRGEPLEIGVTQVIKGWTEALLMMKVGDKWELYIHPDLAYGARDSRTIPGNSALIFEMELIGIK